jgi:phage tail-like protein
MRDERCDADVILDVVFDRLRWLLRNAWPVKVEGPALNATANEVAIEPLELAHEGLELE